MKATKCKKVCVIRARKGGNRVALKFTHDGDNIDKEPRSVEEGGMTVT
jgi:hypothetical protein